MTNTPKEADFPLKQEGLISINDHEKAKAASSAAAASSSAQWLRLKDPRIVRVSRAFGGKDRHSKVCTIRGLRDRRVRLSVPTAIHLYDLQDRLGLNQPSKVVDWLLNAAKDEIDELPPLPIPPGNFTLGYPSLATTSNPNMFQNRTIMRPIARDSHLIDYDHQEEDDNNKQESSNNCVVGAAHVLPNNNLLIPSSSRPNHPSFLGLLNTMPIGNYHQWEPSSSSSSSSSSASDVVAHHQLGNHEPFAASINVLPFPSTLSLSTGNSSRSGSASQILVCPQGAATTTTTQSYFPSSSSHVSAAAMEMDQRQQQINHFHQMLMMSSSSATASSHHHHHQNLLVNNNDNPSHQHLIRMVPKLFHSSNSSSENQSHKGHDFPSE